MCIRDRRRVESRCFERDDLFACADGGVDQSRLERTEVDVKASLFYRIAAVLLVLFAVAHTLGFRQSDPSWHVGPLLASMQSLHFDMLGSSRTYWDLFVAAGFTVGVFYLFAAVLAWQFGSVPAATR